MSHDKIQMEFDRLSKDVDPFLFERLRWDREEGPMLAKLVTLAHGALESRGDFALTEEGATSDIKRFILKVHSNRIIAIVITLENGRALVAAEQIERSKYLLRDNTPVSASFDMVDEDWMAATFRELISRVEAPESAAA